MAIDKQLNRLFQRESIPTEYHPWLRALVPFVSTSLASVDRKALNRDKSGLVRELLGLYVAGVVCFHSDTHGLTYGQRRFLTIQVLALAGWPHDAASPIFDVSQNVGRLMPEHAQAGEDALNAGWRAACAYFKDSDERAFLMPRVKILQWKQEGLWAS